jgi:hypothetical protein
LRSASIAGPSEESADERPGGAKGSFEDPSLVPSPQRRGEPLTKESSALGGSPFPLREGGQGEG